MRPMPGMIIPTATPVISFYNSKHTLHTVEFLQLIALFHQEKKKATNKTSEMKRTRRDRREMEEVMFNLFERQSNWTLRQLIQETDQPEVSMRKLYKCLIEKEKQRKQILKNEIFLVQQFLKDLLRDLCIYNNKGSNQGTYELKPEYKKAPQE